MNNNREESDTTSAKKEEKKAVEHPDPEAQRHYIACVKEYNRLKMKLGTFLPDFDQQLSEIEANIDFGNFEIDNSKVSKDKTENRKFNI